MPCYHPITAWRSNVINPKTGKSGLTFKLLPGIDRDTELKVPCGQCIGCRLERSKQWAMRCMHEASLYENNCYITLTFNDDYLFKRKNPWSVDVRDFQLFMKRLRKKYMTAANPFDKETDQILYDSWNEVNKLRFFHCGEYGEVCKYCLKSEKLCDCGSRERWDDRKRPGRPHYHACIFNFDFHDKQLHRIDGNGFRHFISPSLQQLWPYGFHDIGQVTFESAAYVARYITKKINGEQKEEHYKQFDPETGELYDIKPEYITMSRRPGLGKGWLEKYKEDVYPKDFVTIGGRKMRPAKYYDRELEKEDPFLLEELKTKRREAGDQWAHETTPERLAQREIVQQRRADKLVRPL